MYLQRYYGRIKHDNGRTTICTVATSKVAAIKNIAAAERCPEQAVKIIKSQKLKAK